MCLQLQGAEHVSFHFLLGQTPCPVDLFLTKHRKLLKAVHLVISILSPLYVKNVTRVLVSGAPIDTLATRAWDDVVLSFLLVETI